MPLYTARQIVVLWFLLVVWGCVWLFQTYPSRNTMQPLPACAPCVCEIKGRVPYEGFYCFDHEPTTALLLSQAGWVGSADRYCCYGNIPNGTCITLGHDLLKTDIGATARLNFFMPIPLSTATVEDLLRIQGMGEKTAHAIIQYRNTHQGIRNLKEIVNIPGIGEKKYRLFLPYLTL